MYRRYSANAGVSNMRPVGQNWPVRGFNPARLMNFENKIKQEDFVHCMKCFVTKCEDLSNVY